MKVKKISNFSIVCAASMMLSGCVANSNQTVYIDKEMLKEERHISAIETQEDETQEEETEACFYRKNGGMIEKYIIKNGIAVLGELTNEEKEEQQLYDLLNGRILVWQDCFADDTIDENVWCIDEEEYRDNEFEVSYTAEEENIQIVDGILKILPQYMKVGNGYEWTTASIDTKQNKQFFQGRIEVKMRSTNVTGQHSAVRTLGAWLEEDNSKNGEIDICEIWGDSKGESYKITSNLRYADSLDESVPSIVNDTRSYNNQLDDELFHIVAMEWSKKKIIVYIDNNLFAIYDIENGNYWRQEEGLETRCNPFHMPQYININAAPNLDVVADKKNQMAVEIDWVRVYAPNEVKDFQELVPIKLGIDYAYKVNKANSVPISDLEWSGAAGEEIYLGAIYLPSTVVDRTCEFSVDDESIATIDHTGKLTVFRSGIVSVTVKDMSTGLEATREIILNVEE